MSEVQTEMVDIHSLNPNDDGTWELCVYQTPSILMVDDQGVAEKLQEALELGQSVVLSWDPGEGRVLSLAGD